MKNLSAKLTVHQLIKGAYAIAAAFGRFGKISAVRGKTGIGVFY